MVKAAREIFFGSCLELKTSLISQKVQTHESPVAGFGVFATLKILKNEILFIDFGKVLSVSGLSKLPPPLQSHPLQVDDHYYLGIINKENFDEVEYLNHSCNPNLGVIGNNVFVAMRDIDEGEELFFDYATTETYDMDFECNCGSRLCRKRVRGDDWQLPELQQRYGIFFSSYILEKIKKHQEKISTLSPHQQA